MRIITGEFKGRKLTSLAGDNTRPTSDKIKESLFNIIGPYFYDDEKVLDLYSGSGNLAIEAISRGAAEAYCFDNYFKAIQVIQENVKLTKKETAFKVKKMDADKALDWLGDYGISFDLIFLDPPYGKQTIEAQLDKIIERQLINPQGKIICETDKRVELPEILGSLELIKEQNYGATKISIYRFETED